MGINASLGEANTEKTAEDAGALAEYKSWFSGRGYLSAFTSVITDNVAEIDYRLIIGPAIGYHFLQDTRNCLSADIGPTYVREKSGEKTEDSANARISERYVRTTSKTAKWWQSVEYLPDLTHSEKFFLNAELGTEARLNSYLSIKVVAQNNYDNDPAEDKERENFNLIASLSYNF